MNDLWRASGRCNWRFLVSVNSFGRRREKIFNRIVCRLLTVAWRKRGTVTPSGGLFLVHAPPFEFTVLCSVQSCSYTDGFYPILIQRTIQFMRKDRHICGCVPFPLWQYNIVIQLSDRWRDSGDFQNGLFSFYITTLTFWLNFLRDISASVSFQSANQRVVFEVRQGDG